jgi:hypothetical protein
MSQKNLFLETPTGSPLGSPLCPSPPSKLRRVKPVRLTSSSTLNSVPSELEAECSECLTSTALSGQCVRHAQETARILSTLTKAEIEEAMQSNATDTVGTWGYHATELWGGPCNREQEVTSSQLRRESMLDAQKMISSKITSVNGSGTAGRSGRRLIVDELDLSPEIEEISASQFYGAKRVPESPDGATTTAQTHSGSDNHREGLSGGTATNTKRQSLLMNSTDGCLSTSSLGCLTDIHSHCQSNTGIVCATCGTLYLPVTHHLTNGGQTLESLTKSEKLSVAGLAKPDTSSQPNQDDFYCGDCDAYFDCREAWAEYGKCYHGPMKWA